MDNVKRALSRKQSKQLSSVYPLEDFAPSANDFVCLRDDFTIKLNSTQRSPRSIL